MKPVSRISLCTAPFSNYPFSSSGTAVVAKALGAADKAPCRTTHLAVGIAATTGTAAQLLKATGIDTVKLAEATEETHSHELISTKEVSDILAVASEIACAVNHDGIGPDELLAALVQEKPETDFIKFLREQGIDLIQFRDKVLRELNLRPIL